MYKIYTVHWADVWYGETVGAKGARLVLTPASWLYTLGWQLYASTYRAGVLTAKEPHRPVVCIGNLTVGGSGKTPLTQYVAEMLTQAGKAIVISCSGYGSRAQQSAALAPEGKLNALEWGDEAALLRDNLPSAQLIIGGERVHAAEIARSNFPEAVLVLDDGFQHLPLKKDLTILLDEPGPNHRCLPSGPYREPAGHRKYATLVIPGRFELERLALTLASPDGQKQVPPKCADLLCALGMPQRFIKAVESKGIALGTVLVKRDHAELQEGNLFDDLPAGRPLIVTEKDWVKLRERADIRKRDILIARYRVRVLPEGEFRTWLLERLDDINSQRN